MVLNEQNVIYHGNSIIKIETLAEFDCPVVIKMPAKKNSSKRKTRALEKEYKITRALDSVMGVRRLLGQIEIEKQPALVLEYIEGKTLRDYLAEHDLGLPLKLQIAHDLVNILSKIHEQNIIHLDLNSNNILIKEHQHTVYIVDFGSAERAEYGRYHHVQSQKIMGTLPYIAPEQTGKINRAVDERSDLYSLGIVFYELMTGQLPYNSTNPVDLLHSHIAKDPLPPSEILPDIPQGVSGIILKLLSKNKEDRYQSAGGLLLDLKKCLTALSLDEPFESFKLGQDDRPVRFDFPPALYGRDKEMRVLADTFKSASCDGFKVLFISGYSGVGKTALVEELQQDVFEKNGYFIKGKFDQYLSAIPYSAVTQAFEIFSHQILSETSTAFQTWKDKILSAVGDMGQALINIIPALEDIIGIQKSLPELRGEEAENRFRYLFMKFLSAIASREHPLVLFMDDLQWIDAATLKLLQLIQNDFSGPGLLVIGAFRSNEVGRNHPLMKMIQSFQSNGMPPQILTLDELTGHDLENFLDDTLKSREYARKITTTIHKKAGGNPFFIRRLLLGLYEEGQLRYEAEQGCYQLDIKNIRSMSISENVAAFLAEEMARLPDDSKNILMHAACLGNRFDLSTLAKLSGLSETVALKLLTFSSDRQFIIDMDDQYGFVHDQLHKAAYHLIEEGERPQKHLKIARLLAETIDDQGPDKPLFDIVTHYNKAATWVTDQKERRLVAELNLRAGRKAKTLSAFAAAYDYLSQSVVFMGETGWQVHYKVTLSAYNQLIEAAYLNIKYEEVTLLFNTILAWAKETADFSTAYQIMIMAHVAQNKSTEAIALAEAYLGMLGVAFEPEFFPDLSADELLNLPQIDNREKQIALDILMAISTPIIFSMPDRLPSLFNTMLNLICKYGNSQVSSFAVIWHASMLCLAQGYREANIYGRLSLNLIKKYPSGGMATRVMNMQCAWIGHWESSVHDLIPPLKQYHLIGLKEGEFEWCLYSLGNYTLLLWGSGTPLNKYLKEAEPCITLCRQKQQEITTLICSLFAEAASNLTGESKNSIVLEGKWFSEKKMLPQIKDNGHVLSFFKSIKITLCYLFGNYKEACKHVNDALKTRQGLNPHYLYTKISFYGGLSCIACLTDTKKAGEKETLLNQLALFEAELKTWAGSAPMNYQHQYQLLLAEKFRIQASHWKAVLFYEKAIKGAKNNLFIHDQALANELFAKFWVEQGYVDIAELYIREARSLYHQWDAGAKVNEIETSHHKWFKTHLTSGQTVLSQNQTGVLHPTITKPISLVQTDLDSIIKASRMIARETNIEKLLSKMIQLVMVTSGAQKTVLLLNQEGRWSVEAQKSTDADDHDILSSHPYAIEGESCDERFFPSSVFYYCQRTGKTLVLGDARQDQRFARDRSVRSCGIRSMACFPVLNQGQIKAMVYLENSNLPHVFTLERVEIIEHLCAQFGVSVENALLFENRNQILKTLEQSEKQFRKLMEQSPLAMGILDPGGQIRRVNKAWMQLWGLKGEEEKRQVFSSYNMFEDSQVIDQGIMPLVKKAFDGEEVILPAFEYEGDRLFGELDLGHIQSRTVWIQCHLYAVKNSSGRVAQVVNIYVDITKMKQSENELKKAFEEIKGLKEQLEAESAYLQDEIKLEHNFENIVGKSEPLKYILHRVEQVAPTDSPVLIMGDTGTGKELIARALHKLSRHGKRAMVKVNCAALPGELIESELFGREKGAFTGATSSQIGRFELAKGSTLFLDEIGELPLELQAKLLRVLESGKFERLGSPRTRHSDARIIAATNRVLEQEVAQGRFREDLWYRLKVFPITVPPLRESPEDIPLLVKYFMGHLARKMGKPEARVSKQTMEMLQNYPWPGNVRELKHAIEGALITTQGKDLKFDLPKVRKLKSEAFKSLEEMEREYILKVLKAKEWKIGGENSAASTLKMHVNTLRGRMTKLGIKKPTPQ
jgi:PAS domain S-box-containing protein